MVFKTRTDAYNAGYEIVYAVFDAKDMYNHCLLQISTTYSEAFNLKNKLEEAYIVECTYVSPYRWKELKL